MAVSLPLPYKEDVERWTVEQVTAWLQQREMPEVADIYLRKGIDGHQMLNIPKPKQVAMFWDLSIRERTDVLNIIDQIKNQPTVPLRKSHPARIPSQSQKLLPITKHVQPLGPLQKALPVPPNRVASANISSSVLEVTSEEPDNKIVPFIDEDANEDYLVPLSAGVIGVIYHAPPLLLRNKKNRCPSPSQNAKDNTSNIQSKELPEPPSLRSPSVPYSVESSMKFNSYSTTILQDDENDREERSEQNKEDLNAYEIIHENPNVVELKPVENKEANDKPPDLPNRNVIPPIAQISSTPVVPPRTRSAQHQQPQNTFNPTFRNQVLPHRPVNSTKVPKNQDTALKGVGNSSLSLITPTPQPLINQQRQHLAKKSPLPVVSSTLNTTPQPQSLHKPNNNFIHSKYTPLSSSFPKAVQLPQSGHPIGPPPGPPPSIPKTNISSNTQHDIESPSLSGSGSSLPQPPKTLNLGDGKFVRMNNLYESLLKQPYFHPVVRNVLHKLLTKDCMFLVRPSTHSQHPLTLSLQARGKIFNISIRVRNDAKFALGTEKIGEMAFSSVGEIIEFFRDEPIKLEDGSKTYLKWTPPKEGDYIQPE